MVGSYENWHAKLIEVGKIPRENSNFFPTGIVFIPKNIKNEYISKFTILLNNNIKTNGKCINLHIFITIALGR